MNSKQLRHSAVNLRNRAKIEDNKDRADAWVKEADELDAKAAEIEKAAPAAKK